MLRPQPDPHCALGWHVHSLPDSHPGLHLPRRPLPRPPGRSVARAGWAAGPQAPQEVALRCSQLLDSCSQPTLELWLSHTLAWVLSGVQAVDGVAYYLRAFAASAKRTLAFVHAPSGPTSLRCFMPCKATSWSCWGLGTGTAGGSWWPWNPRTPRAPPCHLRCCCEAAGTWTAWGCAAKPFSRPPWAAAKVGEQVSPSGGAGDTALMRQTRLCPQGAPRKEMTRTTSLRTSRAAAAVGVGSRSGRHVSPPSCRSRTCGGS